MLHSVVKVAYKPTTTHSQHHQHSKSMCRDGQNYTHSPPSAKSIRMHSQPLSRNDSRYVTMHGCLVSTESTEISFIASLISFGFILETFTFFRAYCLPSAWEHTQRKHQAAKGVTLSLTSHASPKPPRPSSLTSLYLSITIAYFDTGVFTSSLLSHSLECAAAEINEPWAQATVEL